MNVRRRYPVISAQSAIRIVAAAWTRRNAMPAPNQNGSTGTPRVITTTGVTAAMIAMPLAPVTSGITVPYIVCGNR